MAKMAQAHQLPACTLPTLASDQRQPIARSSMFPIGSTWATDGILLAEAARGFLIQQSKADSRPSQA